MLDAKISGNTIGENYLRSGLLIPEVQKKMNAFPVSHENVLSWALHDTKNLVSQLLKDRFEGTDRNLEFLSTYYPPSLKLMPTQHQKKTEKRLNHFLEPMKEEFWKEVTEHEMTEWLTSPSAIEAKKRYDRFILEQSSVN